MLNVSLLNVSMLPGAAGPSDLTSLVLGACPLPSLVVFRMIALAFGAYFLPTLTFSVLSLLDVPLSMREGAVSWAEGVRDGIILVALFVALAVFFLAGSEYRAVSFVAVSVPVLALGGRLAAYLRFVGRKPGEGVP